MVKERRGCIEMLSHIVNDIGKGKYKYILVSTTSKKPAQVSRLPDKDFSGELAANFLITDEQIACELFKNVDGLVETVLIDVERKQQIDLMEIANDIFTKTSILPYKPNDVTLEAADQLVMNQLGVNLSGKKVLVYGTGNIAFKLALRLLEREAYVIIMGRDLDKVQTIVTTLNMIKPRYSNVVAEEYNSSLVNEFDGLISFISGEKVIGTSMAIHIKPGGFAIDGGIGNFQGEFIAEALKNQISVFRLDVRLGNPFLLAGLTSLSSENEFFNSVIGSCQVDNMKLVAGGIIGEDGAIIVDRIKSPTQIIGVANGYGGLKNEEQLTGTDRKNLQYGRNNVL